MKIATLCFLLRGDEVCLGMKKRGFGVGKYNGFGGKVGDKEAFKDESIEESVVREGEEEFGIVVSDLVKCAELEFIFPHAPDWRTYVHVFLSSQWKGIPVEGEEMAPVWFKRTELPYGQMWDDDKDWLPMVLEGKMVKGWFEFDGEGMVTEREIEEVVF